MKTEFVDVNDTRKNVRVEISSDVVDAEIDRIAKDYSRRARIPGFRPGKAPARVIKQRFKDQILNEAAHELVPRAIEDAMRERGVEPVDQPDVRDVTIEEGRPLTFTASFETVPAFDPGDLSAVTIARPPVRVDEPAVDAALESLRQRAARYENVEGRGVVDGDTVVVDLVRVVGRVSAEGPPETRPPAEDRHENVSVELGSPANPPGFDAQLLGVDVGATKTFQVQFPADYPAKDLAGTEASYTVTVKGLKRRTVPELDNEFAKDLGEFDTLDALRARVRADLEHQAHHEADDHFRSELMKQLASRVPFEVPPSLVEREIDRRLEEFAGRLMEQGIDPRQAGIDWQAFRESQREVARQGVGAALVLDEIARREQLEVSEAEIEQEIARYAERSGRTAPAVRARLEKEGGLSRISSGLRREKSIDFVKSRATIS